MQLQIFTTSVSQEVPSLFLKTGSFRYFFNIASNQDRFAKRLSIYSSKNMCIFFTKFNTETIPGLTPFFLNLSRGHWHPNTNVYLNRGAYLYWAYLKRSLGYRSLNYSFCDLENGSVMYGIKNQQQVQTLMMKNKKKYIRAMFTNEQLKQLIKDPSNASDNIKIHEDGVSFKDQNMEIRIFTYKTQDGDLIYNYICIPHQKIVGKVNNEKLQLLSKLNNIPVQVLQRELFTKGQINLNIHGVIKLSQIKQEDQNAPCFVILHYKTKQDLRKIMQNKQFNKYVCEKIQIYATVHIVDGEGDALFTQQFSQLRKILSSSLNSVHQKMTKHIIYNKKFGHNESAEEHQNELMSIFPHFQLNYNIRKYSKGITINLIEKVVQMWKNNKFQYNTFESAEQGMGKTILYKPRYQLLLHKKNQENYTQLQSNIKDIIVKSSSEINKIIQKNQRQQNTKINEQLLKITKLFDPKLIFLGTSSKLSNYFRNVSGIMLKIPKVGQNSQQMSIVMDCGEGTYSQFFNHFGNETEEQLLKVKIMFITHLHTDHTCGIFQFINRRNVAMKNKNMSKQQMQKNRMVLIIPENMVVWFGMYSNTVQKIDEYVDIVFTQTICPNEFLKYMNNKYAKKKKNSFFLRVSHAAAQSAKSNQSKEADVEDDIDNIQKCDLGSTQIEIYKFDQHNSEQKALFEKFVKFQSESQKKLNQILKNYGIVKFLPVPVVHCAQSFGIVIQHSSGVKISYSGDCRPSDLFTKSSKNSTVLIHEATFNHNQIGFAIRSRHSTSHQAMAVGFNNDSLMTALTHLSGKGEFEKKSASFKNQVQFQERIKINEKNSRGENFQKYKNKNTFQCFDHMEFKLSEMGKLPQFCKKYPLFANN